MNLGNDNLKHPERANYDRLQQDFESLNFHVINSLQPRIKQLEGEIAKLREALKTIPSFGKGHDCSHCTAKDAVAWDALTELERTFYESQNQKT